MPYPVLYDAWEPETQKRRGPISLYGIFKIQNGVYLGYVENSFCMSWEKNKVRVWSLKQVKRIFSDPKMREDNPFIIRITRTTSPVICDFKTRQDQCRAGTIRKYDGRNVGFVMNPNWK